MLKIDSWFFGGQGEYDLNICIILFNIIMYVNS